MIVSVPSPAGGQVLDAKAEQVSDEGSRLKTSVQRGGVVMCDQICFSTQ